MRNTLLVCLVLGALYMAFVIGELINPLRVLAVNAKQGFVVTKAGPQKVDVRDISSLKVKCSLECEFRSYVSGLAADETGFWFVSGEDEYLFFDVHQCSVTKTLKTKNDAIGILCDPQRKRLLTLEHDKQTDFETSGILVVREYSSGGELHSVHFGDSTPIAITVRSTDGTVGMAFTDGSLRCMPPTDNITLDDNLIQTRTSRRQYSTCFACEFSNSGDMLAAVYQDGVRFSSKNGDVDAWVPLPVGPFGELAFSSDGKEVMVCGRAESVVWIISTDNHHEVFNVAAAGVKWAFYSPENNKRYIVQQRGVREVPDREITSSESR
ncbi:MAG: hypothetical protein DWH81_00605 [Planctomycetota bacterium]|nr:MAG: hypothetical protein DWH81_00605 [Planctomycetota bacterium]